MKQGPLRPYRRELRNGSRSTSIRLRCFEKRPENQRKRAQKSEPTTNGRPPSPPTGELGHVGRPWPSPADTGARPSHGRAPSGAGDPLLGPRQPVSAISFHVSRCLEGQTTSESYETRTVASVSKIASQQFENRLDTISVLREKPRKPKEAHPKGQIDGAWPTPEPPSRGARPWGSAMAEPCRRRGSAIPWPSPCDGQGTPFWVPDRSFSRHPSTFQGVWRVKRPLNPMKQGPLCPYQR